MRKINSKQFLRILKGEDLEFRINPYPFGVDRTVLVADVHLPYDLSFENCRFKNVIFKNCHFSGDFQMDNIFAKSFRLENCQLQNVSVSNSELNHFTIVGARELRELIIKNSDLNIIEVSENPIYETIHLGCGNNVRSCKLQKNGIAGKNSFTTKVFICPERFDDIEMSNSTTDLLHIGSFGQYAQMKIDNVSAEVVLIENCSSELSKVSFNEIKPLDKESSAFHLVNTTFDQEVFTHSIFQNYKTTKIHHNKVDLADLMI